MKLKILRLTKSQHRNRPNKSGPFTLVERDRYTLMFFMKQKQIEDFGEPIVHCQINTSKNIYLEKPVQLFAFWQHSSLK